jgi:hypothetical protein
MQTTLVQTPNPLNFFFLKEKRKKKKEEEEKESTVSDKCEESVRTYVELTSLFFCLFHELS